MNTTIRNTALASILFAAATGAAFAADTADLTVKGVIKPAACNVSLSGGGIIDFGTIAASTLSNTGATALPEKFVTTTVTCDAATKLAVKLVDGRQGTATSNNLSLPYYAAPINYFGLGEVSGKKIGAYILRMSPYISLDGVGTTRIASRDNGVSWAGDMGSIIARGDGSMIASMANSGESTPASGKVFSFGFNLAAAIEQTPNLPALTSEVPLDGQATFSVVYL